MEPTEYERSSKTSYGLYIFYQDRHPLPKSFTSLQYTSLQYTSLHFHTLVDTSLLPI